MRSDCFGHGERTDRLKHPDRPERPEHPDHPGRPEQSERPDRAKWPERPERRGDVEARLRLMESVVVHANDAVLITEPEPLEEPGPRIVYVNEAFTRMTGWRSEEVIGRSPRMLQGPGTDRSQTALIREALERDRPIRVELLNYRKDRSPFWVEISIAPVRDPSGRVTHHVSVQRETTERHRLERTAAEANRALREDIERRERVEAELRRLRRRTELILDAVGEGIYGLDTEGRTTFVNPAAARLLGWEAGELIGQPQHEVIHHTRPDGTPYPEAACPIYAAFRDGAVHRVIDEVFWRKDGTSFPVEYVSTPILEDGGTIVGAVVAFRDVTARRRAEEAQARLIAILDATPDLVGIADAQGRTLYLNRAFRRAFDITEDEDLRRWRIPDYHPEWASSIVLDEAIPAAVRDGAWTGETAILGPTGREVPVSQVLLAHRRSDGKVEFMSTIMRDIAERKRAEEAGRFLTEASRRLSATLEVEATLETITRLLVDWDADYCTVDVIRDDEIGRVASHHRDPTREALVRELCRFAPTRDRPLELGDVLARGESARIDDVTDAWLRSISRDERHLQILRELSPRSLMMVPLRARGRTTGAITIASTRDDRVWDEHDLGLAEDFAERAGFALENARLYREAKRATRVRDEVLAVVSHDLRNPLNTIGLSAGLLREWMAAEYGREKEAKQVDIILRSAKHGGRLIRDLLDVARIETLRFSVERSRERAASAVKEAIAAHRAEAEERGLRLEDDVPDELPVVEVDHDRIVQLFSNLLGNAVRFTPPGGRIAVGGARVGDAVRFHIEDTGPGIEPEHLEHIFDAFWQVRRGEREGAGLGLAIAKGIVDAHEGEIRVESEVGVGATFYVTLPVA
ncbi:MAG: PAS domain S-box protein [Gemmatimonadota bacterium]